MVNDRALVAFIRGLNVGGHRTFRPSVLARALSAYDVVNVGAAGTFVVRKPGSRAKFRAELLRELPFEATLVLCSARDLLALEDPFGAEPPRRDMVRFVSILPKTARTRTPLPTALPSENEWYVRVLGAHKQFVFGVYRRHMKTIGYLGQLDKLFGRMPHEILFRPSPKQFEAWNLLTDQVTTELGYGGAASGGKSYLGCIWIALMASAYPDTAWLIGRKELINLKRTTLLTLFKVFADLGFASGREYVYNQQLNTITFTNESVIFPFDLSYQPSDPLYTSRRCAR